MSQGGEMGFAFRVLILSTLCLLSITVVYTSHKYETRPRHLVVNVSRGGYGQDEVIAEVPVLSVALSSRADDDAERSSSAPPYLDQEGRCHLGAVLYDKTKLLANHHILSSLRKKTVGGVVTSEIKFPNNCSIDLVFSNDLARFKHMDVVVFNFIQLTNPPEGKVLLTTNPNQTFMYFSSERPMPHVFKTPVDVMWTFHRSSDIWIPFGYLDTSRQLCNQTKTPQQWVQGKTKMVLWIASNCHSTTWPRLIFARTLKKHVPVDIYGNCGQLKCKPALSKKCTSDLLGKYKFYLAVENGECGDYITEKVWEKPLMYGTVPIVYGPTRRDYEEILPHNSFIHLSDFKSMEDLASYLKVLDSDPVKYAKYMEWRYHGSIVIGRPLFSTFEVRLFEDLFTAVDMKKKGQLRRRYLRDTGFAKSCRPKKMMNSSYGIGGWYPW